MGRLQVETDIAFLVTQETVSYTHLDVYKRQEQYLVEQVGYANALFRTDFLTLVLSAPLLNEQIHLAQVLAYLIRISSWLIDLVDGEHHWHTSSLRMGNRLLSGRHHRVIGCNDNDGDIGHLSTAGTHGSEGFVTWSIKESNLTAIGQRHTVGPDVLRLSLIHI